MFFIENRTDVGLHHEVEFPGGSQIFGPAVAAGGGVFHLVDTETGLALFAVAHNVAETVHVTGCFPGTGMADDGGIQTDDVVSGFDHFVPPELFHCFFEHGAVGTVIPESVESAVNFRALKNEAAAFAKADHLFHQVHIGSFLNVHCKNPFLQFFVTVILYYNNIASFP